ncbi:MAG: hypothetical protein ACREBQ_04185, partial [Nitrososphaerales archaeon]
IDYILRSPFISSTPFAAAPSYEEAIIGGFLIVVGLFAPGGIMQLRKPLKRFFFGGDSTKREAPVKAK